MRDPARDAEDYYCSLDRPDRDGTVTFTVTVDIHTRARNDDELFENGIIKLNEAMRTIDFFDWDWLDYKQSWDEVKN